MVKSTFKFHRPSQIPLPIVKVNGQVNTKQSSIFQGNNQPFDLSLSVLALWAKARPKKLQRIQIIRPLGSSTLSCCQIAKAPQERLCRISRSFSCNLLLKWEYKKNLGRAIFLPVFCADCVARGVEILSLGDIVDFLFKGTLVR